LFYLLVLLIPNSYTMLFLKFCFLPFRVHVQTKVIYVALLLLLLLLYDLNFGCTDAFINLLISYGMWLF
jgi:hypothetical protein